MSVRVLRQALAQVGRSLTVIALGAGAFYYLVLFSSSAFVAEGGAEFFRDPPRAIEAFLGGKADFLQPQGWLAAGTTHPVVLALMVGAGLAVAGGAVAAEVERGTSDLVLARPVGRIRFLLAKAAAALVAVTVAHAGGLAGVLVARATVERVGEIPMADVGRVFLASWTLFAALSMVALLVSARGSLRSRAVGVSVGLIVVWFFINFIALLIDGLSPIRYASPFHYFVAGDLLAGDALMPDVLVLAALGAAALAGAVWWFARRDLSR